MQSFSFSLMQHSELNISDIFTFIYFCIKYLEYTINQNSSKL